MGNLKSIGRVAEGFASDLNGVDVFPDQVSGFGRGFIAEAGGERADNQYASVLLKVIQYLGLFWRVSILY